MALGSDCPALSLYGGNSMEPQKLIKKLNKKLNQIIVLKSKNPSSLDADARSKVKSESAVRRQLEDLQAGILPDAVRHHPSKKAAQALAKCPQHEDFSDVNLYNFWLRGHEAAEAAVVAAMEAAKQEKPERSVFEAIQAEYDKIHNDQAFGTQCETSKHQAIPARVDMSNDEVLAAARALCAAARTSNSSALALASGECWSLYLLEGQEDCGCKRRDVVQQRPVRLQDAQQTKPPAVQQQRQAKKPSLAPLQAAQSHQQQKPQQPVQHQSKLPAPARSTRDVGGRSAPQMHPPWAATFRGRTGRTSHYANQQPSGYTTTLRSGRGSRHT